jgi:magnesium chelatase family protein
MAARNRQKERYRGLKVQCNALLGTRHLREFCSLSAKSASFLTGLIDKMKLSARAYDRILRMSRTIADIEGNDNIDTTHLMEAAQFRGFDKEIW